MNRGAGDGLEIPVEYMCFGDKRAVLLAEVQVNKTENDANNMLKRCMR